MTSEQLPILLTAIASFVASLVASILAIRNGWQLKQTEKKVDGRLTKLLKLTSDLARAKGALAEKARSAKRRPT